jgi:hypothetical protein
MSASVQQVLCLGAELIGSFAARLALGEGLSLQDAA